MKLYIFNAEKVNTEIPKNFKEVSKIINKHLEFPKVKNTKMSGKSVSFQLSNDKMGTVECDSTLEMELLTDALITNKYEQLDKINALIKKGYSLVDAENKIL